MSVVKITDGTVEIPTVGILGYNHRETTGNECYFKTLIEKNGSSIVSIVDIRGVGTVISSAQEYEYQHDGVTKFGYALFHQSGDAFSEESIVSSRRLLPSEIGQVRGELKEVMAKRRIELHDRLHPEQARLNMIGEIARRIRWNQTPESEWKFDHPDKIEEIAAWLKRADGVN